MVFHPQIHREFGHHWRDFFHLLRVPDYRLLSQSKLAIWTNHVQSLRLYGLRHAPGTCLKCACESCVRKCWICVRFCHFCVRKCWICVRFCHFCVRNCWTMLMLFLSVIFQCASVIFVCASIYFVFASVIFFVCKYLFCVRNCHFCVRKCWFCVR